MKPVYINAHGEPVSETEALRDGVLLNGFQAILPLAMKDGRSRISDAQAEADASASIPAVGNLMQCPCCRGV